jgi:hypothetical protein
LADKFIYINHNNHCSFSNYFKLYENVIQTHTSALTHFDFNSIYYIDINAQGALGQGGEVLHSRSIPIGTPEAVGLPVTL